jgi:hypothetical protein
MPVLDRMLSFIGISGFDAVLHSEGELEKYPYHHDPPTTIRIRDMIPVNAGKNQEILNGEVFTIDYN